MNVNKYGTYIVLCHLRVTDRKGYILLDYVKDVESGSTQWTSGQGLYNDWYPHPAETDMFLPTSTPSPDSYPPPEASNSFEDYNPTLTPYP